MIVKELRQLVCNVKRNHPQQLQRLLQQLQGVPKMLSKFQFSQKNSNDIMNMMNRFIF